MVISISLKTTFSQISIHSQLLEKILQRSDKEKTLFKAIKKYRYGLWKTVSKHLKLSHLIRQFKMRKYWPSEYVESSFHGKSLQNVRPTRDTKIDGICSVRNLKQPNLL